jgi:hypothetical protein
VLTSKLDEDEEDEEGSDDDAELAVVTAVCAVVCRDADAFACCW